MSAGAGLHCPRCGGTYPLWERRWRCDCGGPLSWWPDPAGVAPSPGVGLWRYAARLPPVSPANRLTLGEVTTPTLRQGGLNLKLEYFSPSGSFKDRGSGVLASCLCEMGIGHAVLDSSGNAGSASSAYLAAAGIDATVFVPAHASSMKLRQIAAYGSDLKLVDGDRSEVTARAQAWAEQHDAFYASHLWSPFFIAGTRVFALELAQAGPVPDAIVFPVGAGSLLLGAHEGFRMLANDGLLDRVPRLFGVQASACAPLAEAFASGELEVTNAPIGRGGSVAEGILVAAPPRDREVLEAVRESRGGFAVVEDADVLNAHEGLRRSGVFAEPTAAAAIAGYARLLTSSVLGADDRTLVVLTGSGLKAT